MSSLAAVIGCEGALQTAEGLSVAVWIIDARRCYGRVDYQVQPLKGAGVVWVSAERVKFGRSERVQKEDRDIG